MELEEEELFSSPPGDFCHMVSPAGCRSSCRDQDFLPLCRLRVSRTEMCWQLHMELDWLQTLQRTNIHVHRWSWESNQQLLLSLVNSVLSDSPLGILWSDSISMNFEMLVGTSLFCERKTESEKEETETAGGVITCRDKTGIEEEDWREGRSEEGCRELQLPQRKHKNKPLLTASCCVVSEVWMFVFQSVPISTTVPAATEESALMDWEETGPAAVR